MKNRGFTLIELITTFSISVVIVIMLINVVVMLKNMYSNINIETELLINQGNLSYALNSKINKNNLVNYSTCTDSEFCYLFDLSDGTSEKLVIKNSSIKFGNYVYKLQKGTEVKEASVNKELVSSSITDSEFLVIKISIVNKLYPNKDYGVNLVYPYKKLWEIPTPVSFEEDSWKTIIANVKEGNGSAYEVGAAKEVDLGDLGKHTLRIANNSTPAECNTEGFSQTACGFVIEFADVITGHAMNSEDTNVGGWRDSEMRTYVNETIYNSLPKQIKSNIIDTYVVSGHGSTSGETNFITTDKLYLLSTKEVYGKEEMKADTAREETRQLDYYKSIGVTNTNHSAVIKNYKESDDYWWLRSASSITDSSFYRVRANGNWDYPAASNPYGVSPAFRIG